MRDLIRVLGEPNRRRLLELLMEGELSVKALAAHFDISQPAVSQHLAVLARAGLVEVRKQGRFHYYRVRRQGLADLRRSLDLFWSMEIEDLAAARPPGSKGAAMAIEKSVLVPLDADDTFALLTEPERLRRWQTITARIELRAGGSYRWTITPGHTAAGTVTEIEPGRRMVLTWGWEGDADLPPGASTLTVTLEPAEGGTLVTLLHDGLTDEQAANHSVGWDHYLARLVLAAGNGDAGADEWAGSPGESDELAIAESSLAACQQVLRGLDPASATLPTPCAKFTVEQLLDHLLGSIVHLGAMAGAPVTAEGPGPGTPEARVADAAQTALEAWRGHGVEGEVKFGERTTPARLAAGILSIELFVHAWDIARSTGRDLATTEALAGAVLGLATEIIAPEMRDGDRFAAATEVAPDAGALERLVAFTGRRA